ncbi:hypothetical protein HGRIS_005373 [Hohenbuehelia grisea]|uniref:Uncharacterized protein n=1 Tax=Hohenbuehelia grisea TaxID=104357 RepID=A0ABR3JET4_9AGAR
MQKVLTITFSSETTGQSLGVGAGASPIDMRKRSGIIIGTCIGITILIIASSIVFCRWRRRRQMGPSDIARPPLEPYTEPAVGVVGKPPKTADEKLQRRHADLETGISAVQAELTQLRSQQISSSVPQAGPSGSTLRDSNATQGSSTTELANGPDGRGVSDDAEFPNLAQTIARLITRVAHLEAQRDALNRRASRISTNPPSYASQSPRESMVEMTGRGDGELRLDVENPFL